MKTVLQLDTPRVRRQFNRAATQYNAVAQLQREVGERLLEHLDPVRLSPKRILDVGTGTGVLLPVLAKRYKGARVIGLDIADAMLVEARRADPKIFTKQSYVCADAHALPLADRSIDLVFSNVALQWCSDPDRVFKEFQRVLSPGGLVVFSTFGPDTLMELRRSWRTVDDYEHVHTFLDMHDIGDGLVRAGFSDVVMDAEHIVMQHKEVKTLLGDLKTLGASNASSARGRGLVTRRRLTEMCAAYEGFRVGGLVPATFEVVYAHGWALVHESKSVSVELAPKPGMMPRNHL